MGKVAYKLQLSPTSTIHPVFPVSMSKKRLREYNTPLGDLPLMQEGEVIIAPEQVLHTRAITRGSTTVLQGLIKWQNLLKDDAT